MGNTQEGQEISKEAMKRLREIRRDFIRAAAARVKEQNQAIKAIMEQMKDQPRTVPEIAEATGMSSSDVMWYVATLKKYGQVVEADQDGSYYRYQLAASQAS